MGRSMAIIGIVLITFLSSCYSGPTPIVIRPLPTLEMDVTSDEAYIRASAANVVKLGAYIEELINQCIHKVPTIDLRKSAPQTSSSLAEASLADYQRSCP